MEALGSQVHVITEPDAKGGFLGARLDHLRAVRLRRPVRVLNQYTNPGNWKAHYRSVWSVTFGGAPGRRMIPGLGIGVPQPVATGALVPGDAGPGAVAGSA
jgi:N-(2-amino-2-carboxyethyl)-L-glutamate synthase